MRDNVITALKARWQELKDTFWLLPAAVAVLGPILAVVLIRFDRALGQIDVPFIFGESPSSAHAILTTIAGSLITVTGLTFSVTVVALQLVSSQFTPRVLRGFLSDRVTQATAGGLVGIFGYCLLILTAIRSAPETGTNFVPAVSLTVAIALAFVGLALLLLFIHHTAQSIQAANIAARAAHAAAGAARRPYPGPIGKPVAADAADLLREWRATGEPGRVSAPGPGYVQRVELAGLLRAIARPGLRLHLRVAPGDFVTASTVLADLWPADAVDCATVRAFRRAIAVRLIHGFGEERAAPGGGGGRGRCWSWLPEPCWHLSRRGNGVPTGAATFRPRDARRPAPFAYRRAVTPQRGGGAGGPLWPGHIPGA